MPLLQCAFIFVPATWPGRALGWAYLSLLILVASLPAAAVAQVEETAAADTAAVTGADDVSDRGVAERYLRELDEARREFGAIVSAGDGVEGEDRELLKVEVFDIVVRFADLDRKLVAVIGRMDAAGQATDSLRAVTGEHLQYQLAQYNRGIRAVAGRIADLRSLRDETPPAELSQLETRVGEDEEVQTTLMEYGVAVAVHLETIGVESPINVRRLDQALTERAEQLAGRLQIATLVRGRIRDRMEQARKAGSTEQELADDRHRLGATEQRISAVVASLDQTSELLHDIGRDVTEYRQAVIKTTGKVTDKILDPKVLLGLVGDGLRSMGQWIEKQGPSWIVRLLILIATVFAFRIVARIIWWIVRIFWHRNRASRLLIDLTSRMIGPVATTLGLVVGLSFLGVNPTALLTGVGVLGVIVGLALQDSLGNIAAGMFILIYRPFDVDEVVRVGGVLGVVKAMGLANTTILTFDNRRLYVPNRKVWSEIIENRSVEASRRVDLSVRISYREDLEKAMAVIRAILAEHELLLNEPAAQIFVAELEDSWLEIAVWPWATTPNWWPALTQVPKALQLGLKEAGIDSPVPRRDIEIAGEGKA